MRKTCTALVWLLLFCFSAYGQKGPAYTLIGEGNDHSVKLLWYPNSWPRNLEGFNIKRRAMNNGRPGAWELVNSTPILPEIMRNKELGNVEKDDAEQKRLKEKLQNLLKTRRIREVPHTTYLQKVKTDTYALAGLLIYFAIDYDQALLHGFGLVDRDLPPAEAYEYGLFPYLLDGTTAPEAVATYRWKYGEKPDLAVKTLAYYEPVAQGKKVQLKWGANAVKLREKHIQGYNLYRRQQNKKDWLKLNLTPIWMAIVTDSARADYFDNVDPGRVYEYRLAPVSSFGTEGPFITLKYDPADVPGSVSPPALRLQPVAEDVTGLHLEWDFNAGQEKNTKGFILERRPHADSTYRDVSGLLDISMRGYVDLKGLESDKYYLYRLSAIRKDGIPFSSNELVVYYRPVIRPPAPAHLQGEWMEEEGKGLIKLNWDKAVASDTLTSTYRLYASFPPDTHLLLLGNLPRIEGNSYKYPISHPWSRRYSFAVTAISKADDESPRSNRTTVITPTTKMPLISLWPFRVDSNRITLEWDYKDLPDLKGFRLYEDDKLIADESKLPSGARKWESPAMPYNSTTHYTIEAVNLTGTRSKRSPVLNVRIGRRRLK